MWRLRKKRMKKILSIIILLSFSKSNFAQKEGNIPTTKLTINDVYNASELSFYGYDFSNFRLVDPEKINAGADIKNIQFPAWNAFVLNEITMNKMTKWFKKITISYNPVAITIANNNVPEENVVNRLPFQAEMADIKNAITNYQKSKNSSNKIGMVINVEFFEKKTGDASAYITFFEIGTGAVISMQKITCNSAHVAGITEYWGSSLVKILKLYYDTVYVKGL